MNNVITKNSVLNIIDAVMNNREIDSIRNAILAIRDEVLKLEDEPIDGVKIIKLRGNNELCQTTPWFPAATHVKIDVNEKIDTGNYGSIEYLTDNDAEYERRVLFG